MAGATGALAIAFCSQAPLHAQPLQFAIQTPDSVVVITRDVEFADVDGVHLSMDVYAPAGPRDRAPVLLFFSRGTGEARRDPWTVGWARAAAASGIVAIRPDMRPGQEHEDFDRVLAAIPSIAARFAIDPHAIAVYGASSNAAPALAFVQDSTRTGIRAAAIFYGIGDISEYRLDLPVLFVRAGLDRGPVNEAFNRVIADALLQNAPIEMINHATGYHGFEVLNPDDATRDVIERTLDFVKRATGESFHQALAGRIIEAKAAARMARGAPGQAAELYAVLAEREPENPRIGLSLGEALLAAERFDAACDRFGTLRGKGLGPRDLGVPAARACVAASRPDEAVAWLRSIPSQYLPRELRNDPAFQSIRGRSDFIALFRGS